jgi:hypothetical protein
VLLGFEEAVDRSRLSDRFKSCGQAPRDRLAQLVKHEPRRRDSFFFEEKRHRGGCATWAPSSVKLTKREIFYFSQSLYLSGELIRKNGNTPARGNKVELILFGQQHELSD